MKMDKAEAAKLKGPRSMTPCGAALVHHRTMSDLPRMPLQDSIKMWLRGFFYVKNVDPSHDGVNLPPFDVAPPTVKKNWKASYPKPIAELFEILQVLDPPTTDVETSDPSEIEDEGVIEPRAAVSEGLEEALESEGSEPPGEHLKPSLLVWTDNDETPPTPHDAAFGEDPEDLEEVTSPPLTRGRLNAGEMAAPGEAARNKGKGSTTSKTAPKRAATGPPAGGRGGGAKKHCVGAGRKRVPVVAGDAEDVEEETTSTAERAALSAIDATKKALDDESTLHWETTAHNTATGQSKPSRTEKPAKEKRSKTKHNPAKRACVEEPASEAAPKRAQGAEPAKSAEPVASTPVDLEVISDTPEVDVDGAPEMTMEAPEATIEASSTADPPPTVETAPTGTSRGPAANPPPGDGTIIVVNRASRGAGHHRRVRAGVVVLSSVTAGTR
ncbi:hypothetical protein ZWY2020_004888 [Hordeum vulgare]|nr:hypothetical protein ZWY2020_004888 [Hordeum vulgare]